MKKIMLFITSLTLVAQQVSAKDDVEFSYKGVFSIEPGKAVVFATTNCKNTGDDTKRFQWKDDGHYDDNQPEGYVLSSDEWTYLIVTRDADKEQKDALGTVKGEKGLILLPDDWVQPNDVPAFKPVTEGAHYNLNIYDAEQWAKMEEAGAIFLPCQGYAYDKEDEHIVENENDHGVYWARDQHSGSEGKCLRFYEGTIHDMNHGSKQNYYSVRLVRNVIVFDENDSQEEFADKFGKYKTSDPRDKVFVRRYLLHNGYFNTICLPFEVDKNNSPLQDAEVFTVESGTVVDGCLHVNIAPLTAEPGALLKMKKGIPYLIRWTNDTDFVPLLVFHNVNSLSDWVENATDAGKSGDDALTYQGFFGMTHIEDETNGANEHYNFFLGAENELFWPTDGSDSNAKMKGFRAYFSLTPSMSAAPRYRGMPAKLQEISVTDPEDDATRLNQPSATPNCQKVFDADKVVIILDGKKYSIGGQEL